MGKTLILAILLISFFTTSAFAQLKLAPEKTYIQYSAFAQLKPVPENKHAQYKVKVGDTLSNISRRLKLYPIWTPDGSIEKTIVLNLHNPELIKDRHKLEPDRIISLPIKNGDKRFMYDKDGLLVLQKFVSDNYPYNNKKKNRRPASKKTRKIKNLNLDFDCEQAKDLRVFTNLSSLMNKYDSKIENLNINFLCKDNGAHLSNQPVNQKKKRKPALYKKPQVFKLKPWMMSFAPQNSVSGSSKTTNNETSFFFPSIGYNVVNYSEGTFDNSFTNAFVAFRYRQLISKPFWHVDTEIKYGALSVSNDLSNSDAHMLDVDFRIGRAFKLFNEPWHFTVFSGVFYTQMLVSDNLYGYKGTFYPQIYPEIRRTLSSGDSIQLHLKIVPTGKNFFEVSGDMAFTLGAQYDTDLFQTNVFFNLSHSSLKFEAASNTDIKVEQTSFGIGAGF